LNWFPARAKIYLFSKAYRLVLETIQTPIQWVPGTLSMEVKWLGCEVDHLPPSNAEVNNELGYTSTPTYALMACIGTALCFTFYSPYTTRLSKCDYYEKANDINTGISEMSLNSL
jgi:hypothetical protein